MTFTRDTNQEKKVMLVMYAFSSKHRIAVPTLPDYKAHNNKTKQKSSSLLSRSDTAVGMFLVQFFEKSSTIFVGASTGFIVTRDGAEVRRTNDQHKQNEKHAC